MKHHLLTAGLLLFAATSLAIGLPNAKGHRYVVERSFAKGALDGLDAAAKATVNRNNAKFGVRWIVSYANADRTRTFCIYDGPSEQAIRDAARANRLPVDAITEVPVTLNPD